MKRFLTEYTYVGECFYTSRGYQSILPIVKPITCKHIVLYKNKRQLLNALHKLNAYNITIKEVISNESMC